MTETSRRAVLRAGVLAVAAAPLVAPAAAAASGSSGAIGPAWSTTERRLYRRSRFTPWVGAAFVVVEPGRRWRMRLTGVDDLSPTRPGDEGCFTLTFSSARPGPGQGTVLLRRAGFPATTMFLVPGGNDRRTYQAVVNTL